MNFTKLFEENQVQDEDFKCTCRRKAKSIERVSFDFKNGCLRSELQARSNEIHTNKYNIINFLPKILYHNAKRVSNVYFFIISLIMLISPELSPFSKFSLFIPNFSWITIFPWGIFLLINVAKELHSDSKYRSQDKLVNERVISRGNTNSQGAGIEEVPWKSLQVGDIVFLRKNEICPADMILLDTNEVRDKEAVAFLDESAVSGVSDIQIKKSVEITQCNFWSPLIVSAHEEPAEEQFCGV